MMMCPMSQSSIEPDTKDWTWVLARAVPRVRFVTAADLAGRTSGGCSATTRPAGPPCWPSRARPSGPTTHTWSPLEYACHVRDVHRMFGERLDLMLDAGRADRSPTGTRTQPRSRAATTSRTPRWSAPSWWRRPRRWPRGTTRSGDAPEETLGPPRAARQRQRVHGRLDRPLPPARRAAPQPRRARAPPPGPRWRPTTATRTPYSDATWDLNDEVSAELDWLAGAVGPGGSVLEIGSGGGPRRDRARGARADRAAYGRHARLRRADAQPGLRGRACSTR